MGSRVTRASGRHVAFFPLPATGHIYPNLAVAAELVRRGHRVSFASIERYREVVEAVGAALLPYRPVPYLPPGRGRERRHAVYGRRIHAVADARSALPQLRAAFADDPPDVALCDGIAYGGQLLAARLGTPTIQTRPTLASNEHWSLADEFGDRDVEASAASAFHERLAEVLAEYGVASGPVEFLDRARQSYLVYLPRAFQYRGETFDDRFNFVGPCLRRQVEPAPWEPQPDGRPVVLVTLGTVDNRQPEFFRTCLAACAGAPWRVLLAVGAGVDRVEIGSPPANVTIHRSVPQLEVLRHAAVLVSHGGMGGIMEALANGVPLVTVPQSAEQNATASRVAELGLGLRLTPAEATAPALRAAIEFVRTDAAIAGRIATMREEIRTAGGPGRAADLIEARCAGQKINWPVAAGRMDRSGVLDHQRAT
jgi:MGT family glycosyltransferase